MGQKAQLRVSRSEIGLPKPFYSTPKKQNEQIKITDEQKQDGDVATEQLGYSTGLSACLFLG
eukprot:3148702-Amphidinium_carterae.2